MTPDRSLWPNITGARHAGSLRAEHAGSLRAEHLWNRAPRFRSRPKKLRTLLVLGLRPKKTHALSEWIRHARSTTASGGACHTQNRVTRGLRHSRSTSLAAHVARGAGLLAASRRSRSHVPRGAMSLAEQEGVARGALPGACFLGYYPRPL